MKDNYQYALDEQNDVIPGSDLYYAYTGAGFAMLIDRDGTGVRVQIGTRNVLGVSDDELVLYVSDQISAEEASEAASILAASEKVASEAASTLAEHEHQEASEAEAEASGCSYDALTKNELKELLDARELSYHGNMVKSTLIAILLSDDETENGEEGEMPVTTAEE